MTAHCGDANKSHRPFSGRRACLKGAKGACMFSRFRRSRFMMRVAFFGKGGRAPVSPPRIGSWPCVHEPYVGIHSHAGRPNQGGRRRPQRKSKVNFRGAPSHLCSAGWPAGNQGSSQPSPDLPVGLGRGKVGSSETPRWEATHAGTCVAWKAGRHHHVKSSQVKGPTLVLPSGSSKS